MVLLTTQPPTNNPIGGIAETWENLRREKYNSYEGKIRNSIEGIQKIRMGSSILDYFYPSFAQSALAELEIYRRLQVIGDYTPEEVTGYRLNNPNIDHHLKSTFGRPIPTVGLILGTAAAVYLIRKPLNIFQVTAVFLSLPTLHLLANKWNPRHKYETLKFLDWTAAQRTSKYHMEKFRQAFPEIQSRDFKRNYPDQTLLTAYNGYLEQLEKY